MVYPFHFPLLTIILTADVINMLDIQTRKNVERLQYNHICSIIFLVKMERVQSVLTKDNRQLCKIEKNAERWIVAMSRSS